MLILTLTVLLTYVLAYVLIQASTDRYTAPAWVFDVNTYSACPEVLWQAGQCSEDYPAQCRNRGTIDATIPACQYGTSFTVRVCPKHAHNFRDDIVLTPVPHTGPMITSIVQDYISRRTDAAGLQGSTY